MYCKYCGAQNADDGKFCQSCGQPLVEEEPAYAEPAYAEPAYAQSDYSQSDYAEPDYAEPDYAEPIPVVQSKNTVAKVMGLVALTLFFVSFILVLSNGSTPSALLILELVAFLMLGIGLWIPGVAGRVITGIAPLLLALVAMGSLVNAIDFEAPLQILGYLHQIMFVLCGIGILVRVKGMIIGGTIPALIGCIIANILFYAVEVPYVFEIPEVAAMLVFACLAYVFACITLFCYRPQSK